MDLGFAGLIEKIEERFGKLITNFTTSLSNSSGVFVGHEPDCQCICGCYITLE